ncbi:flagellar motor switch protein G [Stieleria maiorica]|uniref:Flagellar motor switch protein G n=1 Tax=Stieleria maiorica TaxID=2795974 RepID=A0A5B9M8T4_9BACT|nr:FliG C-terminal domain-containing protein [Stieleria maiorica]QEF97568.1 flagellar motor switch protein G [Stieleria maiorica]
MITSSETSSGSSIGHSDSIRQIAILLHTLPQRTHRVLLGQLGAEDKRCITEEMSAMGEVDAMEQVHVLNRMRDDLQTETSRVEKVESEIQDEIQIGRARVSKKRSQPMYRGSASVAESSAETTRGTTAPQASSDDGVSSEQLASSDALNSSQASPSVPETLPIRQADCSVPDDAMRTMFAQFHQTQAAGVLPPQSRRYESDQLSVPHGVPEEGPPESCRPTPQDAAAGAPPQRLRGADPRSQADELAERIDRFLTQLPPQELCRALGMVSTKQAFLVLCGLPNATAETVLDMLPRRQARKVRSDMRRMGQLQLSDIDAAKQIVAQIAIRFTQQPSTSLAA